MFPPHSTEKVHPEYQGGGGWEAVNMGPPPPVTQPTVAYVMSKPDFPYCHLITSVISVFCCSVCGIPAMVLALLSYSDHRTLQMDAYENKRKISYGLGIAGIVLGSLMSFLFFIGVVIAISNYSEEDYDKLYDHDDLAYPIDLNPENGTIWVD